MTKEIKKEITKRLLDSTNLNMTMQALREEGYLVYELEDSPHQDGGKEYLYRVETEDEQKIIDFLVTNNKIEYIYY